MNTIEPQLLEDVFLAYFTARRSKRNSINQLQFEMNLESNLISLAQEIQNKSYEVSPSICFCVDRPVKREIFAAEFRDRVVHHLVYNYINPAFERQFIHDSYSCRVGFGTHYGIQRLQKHIRSASDNYRKTTYVLKLDIEGYFMSINRQILFDKIESNILNYANRKMPSGKYFREEQNIDRLLYLLNRIIFNEPTRNCRIKGHKSDWDDLPTSKSLFYSSEGCGLPIGNLTSQLFSNVYLSDFDNYVKRELKVKYYGRYVDDFYLITNNRQQLIDLKASIARYLQTQLGLKLHPKKVYLQEVSHGVSYLGVFIKPYRSYVGRRIQKNMQECFYRIHKQGQIETTDRMKQNHLASINSYLGICQHYNSYHLRQKLCDKLANSLLELEFEDYRLVRFKEKSSTS